MINWAQRQLIELDDQLIQNIATWYFGIDMSPVFLPILLIFHWNSKTDSILSIKRGLLKILYNIHKKETKKEENNEQV